MGHLRQFLVILLVCVLIHLITASGQTSMGSPGKTTPTKHKTTSSPTPGKTTPATHKTTSSPTPGKTTPAIHKTTSSQKPSVTPGKTTNTTHKTTSSSKPSPTPGKTTNTTHKTTIRPKPSLTPGKTPNTTNKTTIRPKPSPTPGNTTNTTHKTTIRPKTSPTPGNTANTTHKTTIRPKPSPTPGKTTNTTHKTTIRPKPSPTPSNTTNTTHKTTIRPKPSLTPGKTTNTTHKTTIRPKPSPTPGNTTNTTHKTTISPKPSPTPGNTTNTTHKTTIRPKPSPTPGNTTNTTHKTTLSPKPSPTPGNTTNTTHKTAIRPKPSPTPGNTTNTTHTTTIRPKPSPTPSNTTNTTHKTTIRPKPSPTPGNTTNTTHKTTTRPKPSPTPGKTTTGITKPTKPESSPSSKPSGTTPSTGSVTGKVTIMEVYYDLPQGHDPGDLPEFIELYGDRNLSLQGYTIVLFAGEDMKAVLIVSLDRYSLRHSNGAFVMATFNASFGPDLVLTNKSLTGPSGQITMVTLYKNDSSSFTSDSTPSRDGLVDYVVYSSGTSVMPSVIRDWSPGFKAVVKDSQYPYESVSRCYSDEPKNQRAFTLSHPTPGKQNACDLRDDYPIINEIGHLGKQHTCFIEIQFSNNASQALNSFFLAIYSKATTAGHSIQNVTFDLWNERINESGYYLLSGMSNGSQTLDCGKAFVEGTIVVVLYQVPTDLRHFNKKFVADDTYQYIKDGVAFNISSERLDTTLAQIVLPKPQDYPRVSLYEGGPLFLSGNQSLSSCGRSGYKLTGPTPGGPNHCPPIPSTAPPVTTPTTHHTVKPNHVYINEVTYSAKNSEEYIEFKGDTQGDFSHYYIILFNTCTGTKLGGVPLNHGLDQNGFLRFNHTSTHTFSETLQHTGSLALGLYTYDVSDISVTEGLLDAIVMETSTKLNCSFLSLSLKYLTPNVKKPVVLSKK
ncbi:uncharacterized protein LOC110466133 [Mizuhopecten yessoensis]|uniref:uncharacterized protein LOC110466133 n=1 Tax=Mizuhopecten yessoensis TaxID=6573 RepID=UPI000B459AA4|nr:uncharacterized protein LOC110466133 [Mizuhopecten yessoensis]